jgi:hypothetical protein
VVRTLRQLGHRAPVNEAVVELAHMIERGALYPDPSVLELLIERSGLSVVH